MPEVRVLNEKPGISINGNIITLPPGTAALCKNWKCVRDNIYTKVRGRAAYGTNLPSQNIVQMYQYKDRLHCHMGNDAIYYDSNGTGTFTQITGSYAVPETDYKLQNLETASNSYICTGSGIYKSDTLGGTYTVAGSPKGLSFDLRTVSDVNWLSDGNTTAYRIVWSIEDANNLIISGSPSERQEVTNNAGSDRAVELRIYIPSSVTVNYYCNIYRSTQGTTTPPEDFQLVYQATPTAAEIAASTMTVNDILADDWRGASLYTNTTQEGISKANALPPLANSITQFKSFTFYGNIENRQRLYTALISTTNLTTGVSTVTINDGTNAMTLGCYVFSQNLGSGVSNAADNGAGLIRITTTGAHGLSTNGCINITGIVGTTEANGDWSVTVIDATNFDLQGSTFANPYTSGGTIDFRINNIGAGVTGAADNGSGLIRITTSKIHGLTTGDFVRIYDTVGTTEANGTWGITAITTTTFDLVSSTFANAYTSGGTIDLYEDYGTGSPRFILYKTANQGTDAQNIAKTAQSIVRCLNLAVDNTYWDAYYNSSSVDPAGKIEISAKSLGATAFYLVTNAIATTGTSFTPTIPDSPSTDYVSTNDDFQNAVMWSKEDQPEAVPLINIKRIGSADDPILGIVGLRDSLFVIKKKDGVWRLTGESELSWNWDEFDGTVECIQKNSIAKGENSIYMMSSSGYVKISDVGIEVIGRDTEKNDLKPIDASSFSNSGYGWYYESEKSYKTSSYIDQNSTSNDILKEFNTFTLAWTQREFGKYTNDSNISVGIVVEDVEYTAPLLGNGLLKERKDLAITDYTLPDISNTITAIDSTNHQITLGTACTIHDDAIITQGSSTRVVTGFETTNVLTMESTTGLSLGSITIKPGIYSDIKYQLIHGMLPEYEKMFDKGTLYLDNDETSTSKIYVRTSTDADTSEVTTTIGETASNLWEGEWDGLWGSRDITDKALFLIPDEHSRASHIYLRIIHAMPKERVDLNGYSLIFDVTDSRYQQ